MQRPGPGNERPERRGPDRGRAERPAAAPPRDTAPRRRPRGERLTAPRDTGIVLSSARGRGRKRTAGRDDWMLPLLGIMTVLVAAGLAAYWGTLKPPAPPARASADVPEPLKITAPKVSAGPTPFFATYGATRIRLPVSSDAITAVAFHQATFNRAQPMVSLVPDMSLGSAKTIAAQLRALASGTTTSAPAAAAATAAAATSSLPGDTWHGRVIRLYRSGRRGKPDTAVDVGAVPGTPVVAPVDGMVVLVRPYKLYGKYDDYEVHISPSTQSDVDVVLIHIDDVSVRPGQRVTGGETRIACVRRLSNFTDLQLKDYVADGGDHTHVQINRLPAPGMLWISTPGGIKTAPFATSASAAGTTSPAAAPANE